MKNRKMDFFERIMDGLATVFCAKRCKVCGGRMRFEHFHPPEFVCDGVSGMRAKCPACGHTELVSCRLGS